MIPYEATRAIKVDFKHENAEINSLKTDNQLSDTLRTQVTRHGQISPSRSFKRHHSWMREGGAKTQH